MDATPSVPAHCLTADQMFSYTLDAVAPVMTSLDWARMFAGGATPNTLPTWRDRLMLAIIHALISPLDLMINRPTLAALLAVLFVCSATFACIAARERARCGNVLLTLVLTSYLLIMLINLIVPPTVYMCNAHDAALLRERYPAPLITPLSCAVTAIAVALGKATASCCRVRGRTRTRAFDLPDEATTAQLALSTTEISSRKSFQAVDTAGDDDEGEVFIT